MATDFIPIRTNKEILSHHLDLCEASCSGTGRAMVHLHFNLQPQEWAAAAKCLRSSHHWAHTWHLRPIEMYTQHLLALGPLGFYSKSRGATPLSSHIPFRLNTTGIWNTEV